MIINGLMKLTALDFPGRVACTVFSGGCNMRCPFCHNATLVQKPEDIIPNDQVLDFLKKRKGLLDGVCFTGGEPLLQPDIADFMEKVKELGYLIKLDTNGTFPEKLMALAEKGLLDYVAMDIKNSPEKYKETAGMPGLNLDNIKKSKDFLLSGTVDYEFRTTVVKEYHTVESITEAAEFIKGAKRYYLQCFKDSGDIICGGLNPHSKATLQQMKQAALTYVDSCELRGI